MSDTPKPSCYECKHRVEIPGEAHSRCTNLNANVTGSDYARMKGWFFHPYNFDPAWLLTCDGWEQK